MSNTESTGTPAPTGTEGQNGEQAGATFTQADVDRIIGERLVQQAKNKFGDYDELKSRAEGAKTLEERFGALETELSTTKSEALRTRVAAQFGVSTTKGPKGEPSRAELLLTGTDEATLTAQAKAIAGLETDRKKKGNFAPKEGVPTNIDSGEADLREFAKKLFNKE